MKKEKGFTLIELLVVIAIIGILSSVVLASLNTARTKANQAKIAAQVAGMRAAAENFYSGAVGNNTYGTTVANCTTAATLFTDTTSGMSQYTNVSNYPSGTTLSCNANTSAAAANGSAYAVMASSSAPSQWFCVDSTGMSIMGTTTFQPDITDQKCL